MSDAEGPTDVWPISRLVRHVRSRNAKASGAALTEFFFLTIILVPLLFGTAMLGKHIDITQRAVMASRFAVWETTVHAHGATPDDVHARFFARPAMAGEGQGEDSETRDAAGTGMSPRDAVAIDADDGSLGDGDRSASDGAVTLARTAMRVTGVGTRYETPSSGGVAAGVGRAVNRVGNALGSVSGGEWNLTGNGMTRGVVDVALEGNGWFDARTFAEHSVVMNDGWSASGLQQLNGRTKSLVPAGGLDRIADTLSQAGRLPVLKELRGLEDALGLVDASALPLPEVRTLQPYSERSP